jgi:hypothetical protein
MKTIKISEEEATIRRLMDSVFMKVAEVEHLRQENEKLSADSVVLDKIIKVVDGFDHNPDACMEDICEIIDGRGD